MFADWVMQVVRHDASGIIRAICNTSRRSRRSSLSVRQSVFVSIVTLIVSASSLAQREAVLKQIDEPHPYYFREMYLPELTTGPSSVAWAPDSKSVVYSMAGSLWLQKLDSQSAEQLTTGPGYDYQPDWSAIRMLSNSGPSMWPTNSRTL
jgi:hypothetical protein